MKEKNWKEIPLGGLILEAGNAEEYETGSWRTYRPIRNEEKCTHCLLCWVYCPDSSIIVEEAKIKEYIQNQEQLDIQGSNENGSF